MPATETDTLFPLPEPAPVTFTTWEERAKVFAKMSEMYGGLLPLSALHDILSVSRARVHQLAQANRFENVSYFGQAYVTGRSIKDYLAEEKVTGRGHKKIGVWKSIVVGVKSGMAFGESLGAE